MVSTVSVLGEYWEARGAGAVHGGKDVRQGLSGTIRLIFFDFFVIFIKKSLHFCSTMHCSEYYCVVTGWILVDG